MQALEPKAGIANNEFISYSLFICCNVSWFTVLAEEEMIIY